MFANFHTLTPPDSILSHLWLHEPGADTITRAARELGLPTADPTDLALAYADLFLLNIPPYGTVFTDSSGEMNGPAAQEAALRYETHGYRPPDLNEVGAPDHLGLCLGFLAHLSARGLEEEHANALTRLAGWAPLCCLAVEREPAAHPFYHALATCTREWLLVDSRWPTIVPEAKRSGMADGGSPLSAISDMPSADEEVRLRDVVRFFLTPARCGMFLSRSRLGQMAKACGMRLPFGSRFAVAEMLFRAVGEVEGIEPLLALLSTQVEAWAKAYRGWAETHPAWQPVAEVWLARTATTAQRLQEMRHIAEAEPT